MLQGKGRFLGSRRKERLQLGGRREIELRKRGAEKEEVPREGWPGKKNKYGGKDEG